MIRLQVCRAAPTEPLLHLEVHTHESIGQIKRLVASDPDLPSEPDIFLVWAGRVLSDENVTAFQVGLCDDATAWALRNERACGALRSELCARRSDRFLWRGLSAEEEARDVQKHGLTSKHQAADVSLDYAISDSSLPSQFVFSSLDPVSAVYYAAAHNYRLSARVVQIDMSKVPKNRILDVSTTSKCKVHDITTDSSLAFATSHQIVAIRKHVPAEAIVSVHEVGPLQLPRGLKGVGLKAYRALLSGFARAAIQEWQLHGIRKFLHHGGEMSEKEIDEEIESSRMYKQSIQSAMCAPR